MWIQLPKTPADEQALANVKKCLIGKLAQTEGVSSVKMIALILLGLVIFEPSFSEGWYKTVFTMVLTEQD